VRRPAFFGSDGLLARVLPGYEERPAQQRLADAVEQVLRRGGLLLAEAGTGTGKTLAYLLPAVELGRRVVISTGTKNLQEQLVSKDIPLLARALGRDLDVAVMKGRANYLCLLRFRSHQTSGTFRRSEEIPLFRAVEEWAPRTATGDRAEIDDLPDQVDFWREVSAASENCIGQSCSDFDACWVTRMRQRALAADVVVVNHHLLCADLSVRDGSDYGAVIPDYDTVILDEAHLLEDVATHYFGVQVSSLRIEDLCRDVERELTATKRDAREVRAETESLRHRSLRVFKLLQREAGRRLVRGGLGPVLGEEAGALLARLDGVRTAIQALPERGELLGGLAARAQVLKEELGFVLRADDDGHVFFVEARGRHVQARATPIDVSARLREMLFERARATVLTSATLAVDGGFDYLKARLGLETLVSDELLLPSPFDFARQAVFYVPRRMPEPQSPAFVERAAEEVEQLLRRSRGRAFVLFTSYANMHAVAERLAGRAPYPLLVQGEAPKAALLELFKTTPGAVLLATASFWQGVDVVGEQLSCVIIDKLPFASPGDPVVSARIDRLRRTGANAFADYQVPVAVLMLKQGLGRLIRAGSDRGILAVLDSRLVEKSYGRRFLDSLPPARLVHDLAEVDRFVEAWGETAAPAEGAGAAR
jgi:ATP-dependent DNA helicase DinG